MNNLELVRGLILHIVFFICIACVSYGQNMNEAIPLGSAINTEYAERVPLISLDGQALYFARKSHPQNMGSENKDDIWVSYLNPKTQEWTTAVNVGTPLNNDGHNFVVSINTNGKGMYLANDYNQNIKDAISYTTKKGRKWSTPFVIDIPNYKNKSPYVSYHVSKDEKYLLIAAELDKTQGGRDLYVCFKTNSGWSSPLNLGAVVNSKGEENSIFLAADNKTIYFSSEGHPGLGGFDLFMSKRLDNTWTNWSTPQNLGPSINTKMNDLSISIPASGDYAYLARGPLENTDLYKIKLPEAYKPSPVTFIQAQLIDAETKKPVDGRIYFESLSENREDEKSIFNGREANYIVESEQDMGIYAQVKGYFPTSEYYANSSTNYESVDGDNDAYYQDTELQALQNKLDDLQRELKKLKRKKESIRKSKNINSSNTFTSRKQNAPSKTGTFRDVGQEEEELDDLKSKYQQHYSGSDAPADKRKATGKDSDSDALKDARAKYQQYYGKEKEEDKIRTYSTEKVNSFVESIFKDMFNEYFLPVVREVKKEEQVNLSAKDMVRLEEVIKLDIHDEWAPQITSVLRDDYRNNLAKENKVQIKRVLKDEFADNIRTDVSMQIKKQQEKNIKLNISKQLESPSKRTATKPETVNKELIKPKYQKIEKELSLIPLKTGAILRLNNIFFEVNKATLKPQSMKELKRIASFLTVNPQLQIEIGGHTNGWCSPEFAADLSAERAETIYDYLLGKGVSSKRLSFKGYGKSDPIATNDTQAGRRKNQRVELKILEIIE